MDWLTPITIGIDGRTFTGGVGDWWIVANSFEGWYDSPETRISSTPRPSSDGVYDSDVVLLSAREVSWIGRHQAATQADAQRALNWATSLAKRADLRIVVSDTGGSLGSKVKIKKARGRHLTDTLVEFQFVVQAADPRKYGDPVLSTPTGLPTRGVGIASPVKSPVGQGAPGNPGRVTTPNAGTTDTWSDFTITGGLSGGFELLCIETGQIRRIERVIPLGSSVVMSLIDGSVTLDGQNDISDFLTRDDVWSVPQAGSRTIQFNGIGVATGTPTLSASTPPAFL